jgi:hypothetical protein
MKNKTKTNKNKQIKASKHFQKNTPGWHQKVL